MNKVKDYGQSSIPNVRAQVPRAPWELDENHRRGFAQAVHNNQSQMALYYARELFQELDAELEAIKEEIEKLKAAKTTRPAAKAEKTVESE